MEVEGGVEGVAGVAVEGEGAMMTIIMGAEAMAGMTATTEEVAAAAAGTRAGEGPTGAAEAVLAAAEEAVAAVASGDRSGQTMEGGVEVCGV